MATLQQYPTNIELLTKPTLVVLHCAQLQLQQQYNEQQLDIER